MYFVALRYSLEKCTSWLLEKQVTCKSWRSLQLGVSVLYNPEACVCTHKPKDDCLD